MTYSIIESLSVTYKSVKKHDKCYIVTINTVCKFKLEVIIGKRVLREFISVSRFVIYFGTKHYKRLKSPHL